MDCTTVSLDQKAVEFIVESTFESQVEELKGECMEILEKYFDDNNSIKLIDF